MQITKRNIMNEPINEFGEIVRADIPPAVEEEQKLTPNIDDEMGKLVEAIVQAFELTPKEIYVPGSGNEVLPELGSLKDSHITYVDTDNAAVDALQEGGYNAVVADVETFSPPSEVDLLILKGISVNRPLEFVKAGGYVFSDGRMGSAEKIAQEHPDFQLVGVLVEEDGKGVVKKENLDPYKKVLNRTQDELAAIRRNFRMSLINGDSQPKADKPASPPHVPAQGYVFQK